MGNTRHRRCWGRPGSQGHVTWNALLGLGLCVILLLTQVGCRSVYRFHCTSRPFPAGVLVGQDMLGETPCTVKIPKHSVFTFCLPDGREKTHTVDLHSLKPSNPLAEIVSAPLMLAGAGLILSSGAHGDDEDKETDQPWAKDEKEKHRNDLNMGLVGFGAAGAGMGVFHLLGGDEASLNGYDIRVDFDEPARSVGQ
jgi:hypothetical protein